MTTKTVSRQWAKDAEHQIARQCIKDLLAAGYAISVCDGEEWAIVKSKSEHDIYAAMFSGNHDILCCSDASGKKVGKVTFHYGHEGWDVIHDYTKELKDALTETWRLVSKLETEVA